MTKQEFYDKFGLKFADIIEEYAFLCSLDKLYLVCTKEEAIEIVKCYYDNADEIYNDAKEQADTYIAETSEKLRKLFESKIEEVEDDEEELVDNKAEA